MYKEIRIWFMAVLFAIIQMTADAIKAIYTHSYFLLTFEILGVVAMLWLGRIVYRKYKAKIKSENNGA